MIEINPATVTIDGTTYIADLATVERTTLGYEDHGMVRADLSFVYGGFSQSTPGIPVSNPSGPVGSENRRQVGTALGMDLIIRMIDVFGCGEWEKIKGQTVYILRKDDGGLIEGIMSIHDRYRHLIFKQHAAAFFAPMPSK